MRVRVLMMMAALLSVAGFVTAEEIDAESVQKFADEFFAGELSEYKIPGAVFVFVKGDEVLYSQGYGFSELESQTPFDPSATVIRAGSVSKCFTSAALVNLAVDGQLDIDAPVNSVLQSVEVAEPWEPILVKDLLTHTAGFDDTIIDMHERDVVEWLPLQEYLNAEMPAPAMPPRLGTSYSSWDFAVAGAVIEDVTGGAYYEYIDEAILDPLGMSSSTFRLPDPPVVIMERLASGYSWQRDGYKQYPFDYIKASPGIAMLTTAEDMARFIRAQLNAGKIDGESTLNPEVVEAMQTIQFRNHERVRGFSFGFAEWAENGEHLFFHDGNAIGHTTRIVVMPQHDVGFFVAINTTPFDPGGVPSAEGRLARRLTTSFLDTFYPEEDKTSTAPAAITTEASALLKYEGYYRQTNYSRHTFQKLASLLEQFPVTAGEGGVLRIGSTSYVEIEPGVFQHAEGQEVYAPFRADESGAITHVYLGSGMFEKVSTYESMPVQLGIFFGSLVVFAMSGTLMLARWSMVWKREKQGPVRAEWVVLLVAVLNVVFFVGLGHTMMNIDTMELFAGVPPVLKVVLSIPIVTGLLAFAALMDVLRGVEVRGPKPGRWRIWIGGQAVFGLVFVGFLWTWNLVGF